jgi:hypothetical protein
MKMMKMEIHIQADTKFWVFNYRSATKGYPSPRHETQLRIQFQTFKISSRIDIAKRTQRFNVDSKIADGQNLDIVMTS